MNKIISLFIILVFFISCQKEKAYDQTLLEHLDKVCDNKQKKCIFRLSEFTDFKWENCYVFHGPTSNNGINRMLGFKSSLTYIPSNRTRIIYTRNNQVVREYQYSSLENLVQFTKVEDKDKLIEYTSSEAVFNVEKVKYSETRTFYDLTPINRKW